jgi:hypothetical protein
MPALRQHPAPAADPPQKAEEDGINTVFLCFL